MKVILFTDDSFAIGDSYVEALRKLDSLVNEEYYREREEHPDGNAGLWNVEKQEVVPAGMTITDDDGVGVTENGSVEYKAGSWTLSVPLVLDRKPSGNYRFGIMQELKDRDYEQERKNHLAAEAAEYVEEFSVWCAERAKAGCEKCELAASSECLLDWYEKYKKPELEKGLKG